MNEGIVLLPGLVTNRLDGSLVDAASLELREWPEKPSGTATRSERAAGITASAKLKLAAASAGLCEIEIFQHINFGGASWRTNLNYLYVGDWWNDSISSIIVVRGTWRFYQHRDYQGAYWDLGGPAYYPWVEAANIPNDIISSFRCIAL